MKNLDFLHSKQTVTCHVAFCTISIISCAWRNLIGISYAAKAFLSLVAVVIYANVITSSEHHQMRLIMLHCVAFVAMLFEQPLVREREYKRLRVCLVLSIK